MLKSTSSARRRTNRPWTTYRSWHAATESGRSRLKGLCERYQIPLPPLGHWVKSPERQKQDRIPLPSGHLGQQRFWVRRFLRRRAPNHRTLAMQIDPPAAPAEPGDFHHECTRRTSAMLEGLRPDARGALVSAGDGIASVRVSPGILPRALGVLDLLLLAAESVGYSVSNTDGPATLVVGGERVPFSIIEEIERKTSTPTGQLTIVLGETNTGGRRLWADTPFYPVESRLSDLVAEARVHAKAIGERSKRREQAIESRRTEDTEGMYRRKRVTLLMERADELGPGGKARQIGRSSTRDRRWIVAVAPGHPQMVRCLRH